MKLAELFSKHDLDDVKAALAAFRDEDFLAEIAESAARAKRVSAQKQKKKSRTSIASSAKKRPSERLAEIERDIEYGNSHVQQYALRVAKTLLDRQAFRNAPAIRDIFQNLSIDVGKSVSDRSQLVILLFSQLKSESEDRIAEVEKKLEEYSNQNSSLSEWSKIINRKNDDFE
ncbi:hypothetical protein PNH50_15765 [Leisingera aquaemixtae]|uniref:hypothetical protein n=1 Tax=Leisingera aquaemixtae TaxID=1396826 RepID=UPI003983F384